MPEMLINFEWAVDDAGYEFVPANPSEGAASQGQIARRGGKLRLLNPIGLHKSLFMEFANLEETPEACVNFANRFGQLDYPDFGFSRDPGFPEDRLKIGEGIEFWISNISNLRRLVEEHGNGFPFGTTINDIWENTSVFISLLRDEHDGLIKLSLVPTSLEAAIRLQFFQAATSGRSHIQCASPRCEKWFEVGPGGKRKGAKTCSDRCRYDLSNIARAEKHLQKQMKGKSQK